MIIMGSGIVKVQALVVLGACLALAGGCNEAAAPSAELLGSEGGGSAAKVRADLLVSGGWLAEHLEAPGLVVLQVEYRQEGVGNMQAGPRVVGGVDPMQPRECGLDQGAAGF